MTTHEVGRDDEESIIVSTASELCQTLRLSFKPTSTTWMGNLKHPSNLSSDQVVFLDRGPARGRVVLPSALRGRLETGDWKPLIASGLLFQLTPESRRIWKGLGQIVIALLIVGIMVGPLLAITLPGAFTLSPGTKTRVYFSGIFLFFFFVILSRFTIRFFNLHIVKGLRLKADRKAAQVVGKERFLHTLEKIDGMRIEDLEDRKIESRTIWRGKISIWPSLPARIENLQRVEPAKAAL